MSERPERAARRRRSFRRVSLLIVSLGAVAAAASYLAPRPARRAAHETAAPLRSGQLTVAPGDRRPQPDQPLSDILAEEQLSSPIPDFSLHVSKSRLELQVLSGETVLKTYPISLGFAPRGDKARRGDGRTPEGRLYVCQKVAKEGQDVWSEYFIRLSYPHAAAASRGLAEGLITQDQHDEILRALEERKTPPQDTSLGSGLAIHVGGISSLTWTEGCIALRREDGRELYAHTPLGATVAIRP